MKLAIVRQTYNPNGGAERFVSRALNVLAQDTSLDVTLIARQWEDAAGWKTLKVNPPFRNRIARESGFATEAAAHFAQFDIVQSHERIPGATIFRAGDGVHATWLEQYGRILSPLARWAQSLSRYHRYILQAEAQMFTHPQLRKVICNSKMVRDDIARRFGLPDDKLTVIYNGVDTVQFSPEVRALSQRDALGIPRNAPVLAYVGSGFSRKGVATALRAIVAHPDVWLLVAGRDKHARKFEKLAQTLGVSSRVTFLGRWPTCVKCMARRMRLSCRRSTIPSRTSAWKHWPAVYRCLPATAAARRSGLPRVKTAGCVMRWTVKATSRPSRYG